MLIFYRFLINLIFILSPIILIFRLIRRKEDLKRFKEKLGFFSKKKIKGNLIWFHGASVGEIHSIVPILEKYEKDKKINQILVTSNTLSSSKIIKNLRFKKVIHQFFPIDTTFVIKKFLDYWKPSKVFFIDSEIWPNTIYILKERNIPINLLNARISKKTFNRWKMFPNFTHEIFDKFNLCLCSSHESKKYLNSLKAKNVKFIGNLKFSQSENEIFSTSQIFKNFIKKRKVWCASSTHKSEEIFCGYVHLYLKKKYKNLMTILIPRHVERVPEIEKELKKLGLKIHKHGSNSKLSSNTDIYLVNAYGTTKTFYNNCKIVFLGGSLIKHGGQNPLEAARFGCYILHGKNIFNFKEIYEFLKKNQISKEIFSQKDMINKLEKIFKSKIKSTKIQNKIKKTGKKVLKETYKEINKYPIK